MFEQEIEMEAKEGSSFGPLLIILLLVGLFVGGIGVVVYQSHQVVKPEQANVVLQEKFKAIQPVTVTFSTGNVSYGATDSPVQPQYKLLSNAGILKVGKGKGWAAQVDLTPQGKELIASVQGVHTDTDKNGITTYRVPLAIQKLVSVGAITKVATHKCSVQYTWAWQTTKAGDLFEVTSKGVQELPMYDRGVLIDRHGANYYHNPPTQSAVTLVKSDNGWEMAANY